MTKASNESRIIHGPVGVTDASGKPIPAQHRVPIPVLPAGYQLIVQPKEPKRKTDGGIELPEEVIRNQETVACMGRVLDCGPTALDGKTASGIELGRLTAEINTAERLVGQWVHYMRYTGHQFTVRGPNNVAVKLIYITASEILGIVLDPESIVNAIIG